MGRTSDANERLMQAALDLLWAENYGGVTVDAICKRADVRKGSFYYYFPGKAELTVAAIELSWTRDWKPGLDACFSPVVEPLARLRNHLAAVVALQSAMAAAHGKVLGCPMASVGCEISTSEAGVSAAIRVFFPRKRRYFESAIRDAAAAGEIEPCDPAQKALALQGLIDGLVTHARIMNDIALLQALPRLGLDLLRPRAAVGVAADI